MSKYVKTKDDLRNHLIEQIALLKASSNSFNNGFEGEAKRLAIVVRTLVHDTDNSTSLLKPLNKKDILFNGSSNEVELSVS